MALGQYLGIGLTYMNAPEVIREHGDVKDWRNLVGTGPYLLTDWTRRQLLYLPEESRLLERRREVPRGNRLPYIDEIQGLIILEEATYLAGLRTGKIDFLGFPVGVSDITSVEVLESLQKSNPENRTAGVVGPVRKTRMRLTRASRRSTMSGCAGRCRWQSTSRASTAASTRALQPGSLRA